MFRHPKYYKELRKLRNKAARVNDHSASISDQVISFESGTPPNERATGPGLKLQAATHDLAEATGLKQQASSTKLLKQQAASIKPRG